MEKRIRIYSRLGCSYCDAAKEFLDINGINYEEIDIDEDEEKFKEMAEKSGQMGVPVIEMGDNIVVGFDIQKIKNLKGGNEKMKYEMSCDDGFRIESQNMEEASSMGAMHVMTMHPDKKISGRDIRKMIRLTDD